MARVLGRVTSINVRKVLWALDEMGEAYDREDWGLPLRDPKVPEFLTLNPNGTVPVLIEDDGSVLWESNALLIYLAQTRDKLWPGERRELGLALQWLGWQGTELSPSWGYAVMALVRKLPGYDDADKIAACLEKWTAKMDMLEAELGKGHAFVAGPHFSFADIGIGLSLHRWFNLPLEKKEMPASRAYYERLMGREAGARWMAAEFG